MFLGYSLQHKGYKCLDRKNGRVYISRHVHFNEESFPFSSPSGHHQQEPSQWAFVPILSPAATPPTAPQKSAPNPPTVQSSSVTTSATPSFPDFLKHPLPYHYQHRPSRFSVPNPTVVPESHEAPPNDGYLSDPGSSPSPPRHHMVTRQQAGTRRTLVRTDGTVRYPLPRALIAHVSSSHEEPTCYTQAVQIPEWSQAMTTEFNALLKNQSWTLVPPDPSHHVVGCKWVFKLKRKSDGSIE